MRKLWLLCLPLLTMVIMANLMSCSSESNEISTVRDEVITRIEMEPLVGHWNLVGYSSAGVFIDVERKLGNKMFIDLTDDGMMSGKLFNEVSGSFTCSKNGDFSFSKYGGTKMQGDDADIMFVEDHLGLVNKYVLKEGVLQLFFADNSYIEFRL